MSSKLLDHVDHQIFVKSGETVSLCLFGPNKKYFLQNLFRTLSITRPTFQILNPKIVNSSAKFRSSLFKLNVQIKKYFRNIIFIFCI